MPKVFTSSDHHFYHRNIIKYVNRPFDFNDPNCVIDNAKLMIHRHNEVVKDDDIVILVGDISASLRGREDHFHKLLQVLKGKKILVRGNHDHQPDDFYLSAGFIDVVDYIEIGDYFICHYPCFKNKTGKNKEPEEKLIKILQETNCTKIIHGHIHNKKPFEHDGYKRLNVSVDYEPNNYYPIELKQEQIRNYIFSKYL